MNPGRTHGIGGVGQLVRRVDSEAVTQTSVLPTRPPPLLQVAPPTLVPGRTQGHPPGASPPLNLPASAATARATSTAARPASDSYACTTMALGDHGTSAPGAPRQEPSHAGPRVCRRNCRTSTDSTVGERES
jgi:hypothetical protein